MSVSRKGELAYVLQAIKNPLSSFPFTSSLLEPGGLGFKRGSEAVSCEQQISKIVKTWTPKALKMGEFANVSLTFCSLAVLLIISFKLERTEFFVGCVINAVLS